MSFIGDMFGDMFSAQGTPESLSDMLNRRIGNAGALSHKSASKEHVKYFNSPNIPLRLLQFATPWSVHAALRFLGEAYITDQAIAPQAMAKDLPLLIDGNHICSSRMSILHHLYYYKRHAGGDDVLSAYIQLHLLDPLEHCNNDALLHTIQTHGAFGLQWQIARHIVKQSANNPCYTDEWSTERLHSHFIIAYERLSATLQMQPYLHGVSPGMSDSLLFEHMLTAMADKVLRKKVMEFPFLIAHFKGLCNDYFGEFDWESHDFNVAELQKQKEVVFAPYKTAEKCDIDNALVAHTECMPVKKIVLSNNLVNDLEVATVSYRGALFLAVVLSSMFVKYVTSKK